MTPNNTFFDCEWLASHGVQFKLLKGGYIGDYIRESYRAY